MPTESPTVDQPIQTGYARSDIDIAEVHGDQIYRSISIIAGSTNSTSTYYYSITVNTDVVYWRVGVTVGTNTNFANGQLKDDYSEEVVERAIRLLDSLLDEQQKEDYKQRGHFRVVGSKGRIYRILGGHSVGNVEEIDEKNDVVARYCAHPSNVPLGDRIAAQKLHLEHDEDEFIKVANCHFRRSQAVAA